MFYKVGTPLSRRAGRLLNSSGTISDGVNPKLTMDAEDGYNRATRHPHRQNLELLEPHDN